MIAPAPIAALIAALLVLAIFAWFGLPHLARRRAVRHLAEVCARHRVLVLSYDDGPGPELGPRLADLLRARSVRATFFVIGARAERHPDLLRHLQQDGHELGSHTRDHRNAWKSAPWTGVADLKAGYQSLRRIGLPDGPFRPPFGKSTLATLVQAWLLRLPVAYWTVDSRDSWEDPRPVAEVVDLVDRQGGGVVLMHDCDAPPRLRAPERHPAHVLALTEALIDLAARRGLRLLRFGDLAGLPHRSPDGLPQGSQEARS